MEKQIEGIEEINFIASMSGMTKAQATKMAMIVSDPESIEIFNTVISSAKKMPGHVAAKILYCFLREQGNIVFLNDFAREPVDSILLGKWRIAEAKKKVIEGMEWFGEIGKEISNLWCSGDCGNCIKNATCWGVGSGRVNWYKVEFDTDGFEIEISDEELYRHIYIAPKNFIE